MGLFDEILVTRKIIKDCDLRYNCCNKLVKVTERFQTKSLYSCMEEFLLKHNDTGNIQLYKLGEPDQKYWHKYTLEELAKFDKTKASFFSIMSQDGYFQKQAFIPSNRTHTPVQDLHKYVYMYTSCYKCNKEGKDWLELELKFTDGILKNIERKEEK